MENSGVELNHVEPQVVGARDATNTHGCTDTRSSLRMRSPAARRDPVMDEPEDDDYSDWVQQEAPSSDERWWGRRLVISSILDIMLSGIIIAIAFQFAYRANGVSLYCLAIQAMSHFISSVLLALRFCGELALPDAASLMHTGLIRKQRRTFLVREQVLCECMGIVMLISSVALLFKAFRKISHWDKWYLDHTDMDMEAEWATEFLAWYGFVVYLIQGVVRFCAARKLRRSLVWHAFVASVVSLLFLFILGIAASYEKEWSWKAEPIAAILLVFVTIFEAVRIIIMHLDDVDCRLKFDPHA